MGHVDILFLCPAEDLNISLIISHLLPSLTGGQWKKNVAFLLLHTGYQVARTLDLGLEGLEFDSHGHSCVESSYKLMPPMATMW